MYNTFNHSFLFAPWTHLRISCRLQPHCFHEKLILIVWFHSPFPFFPAQSFIRAKLHDRRGREYMGNLIRMKPSHSPFLHLLYFFIFSLLKDWLVSSYTSFISTTIQPVISISMEASLLLLPPKTRARKSVELEATWQQIHKNLVLILGALELVGPKLSVPQNPRMTRVQTDRQTNHAYVCRSWALRQKYH